MKKINLVFGYEYKHADILLVPNAIADDLDAVVQEFFRWIGNPANNKRFLVPHNGEMVLSVGTDEFLWWINRYKTTDEDAAVILERDTRAVRDYPTADF